MADSPEQKNGPSGEKGALEKVNPAGYYEGETMTRRNAFAIGGQAIGGFAGVALTLPLVGFAVAPILETPEEHWQAVGVPEDFTAETYLPVIKTEREGIGEAGKTTVYVREADPKRFPNEEGAEYVAVSTRCAHLGCPVRYIQSAKNFNCPCHGGAYDFEGKVIGGPPVRPLDRFQARLRDGKVEVGPRFSVTSSLEPVRARDPGEFTGGIWEYLYPPRPSTPPAP